MNVTALVMSQGPYRRQWPGLEVVVLRGRIFNSSAEHQAAWNDAIDLVKTEHFCFLDDGADRLSDDYMSVIEECLDARVDLAYTDEFLSYPDGSYKINQGAPYSQALHLQNPMLVHHLAVCRTAAAREALNVLPLGHYWPEMLLYWQMAKKGAAYVPRPGYFWNVESTGLHTKPFALMGQGRSQRWCAENP